MSKATCKTCGGELPNHIPTSLDGNGTGNPKHKVPMFPFQAIDLPPAPPPMTNNTPHTPTDDGELRKLIGIVPDTSNNYGYKYFHISFAGFESASISEKTLDELIRRIHQYGNTRAMEELESFEEVVYYGEYNISKDDTEIGDIVPAWVIRKRKDKLQALTQPEKENK